MKDLLSEIASKILLRLQGIKYGVITVNITVHQGSVLKVEINKYFSTVGTIGIYACGVSR